jgi:hypothetical protein
LRNFSHHDTVVDPGGQALGDLLLVQAIKPGSEVAV